MKITIEVDPKIAELLMALALERHQSISETAAQILALTIERSDNIPKPKRTKRK